MHSETMKNSTCFGQFLYPPSGVYHCTHSNRLMSYRLCWLFASGIRIYIYISYTKRVVVLYIDV